MSRFAYLIALAVLVLNDHVLKGAFPGFITGKLSDFAGVFVLAVFLAVVFPRTIACVAAGLLFVWWKSPLSDPFIAALPWAAARVVDWTDLSALVMLPLAYRASTPVPVTRPAHAMMAMLSVVAFMATSMARHDVPIEEGDALRSVPTGRTLAELPEALKPCGIDAWASPDQTVLFTSWRNRVRSFAKVEQVRGEVVLHFVDIEVEGRFDEDDAESFREDLRKRLTKCLRK